MPDLRDRALSTPDKAVKEVDPKKLGPYAPVARRASAPAAFNVAELSPYAPVTRAKEVNVVAQPHPYGPLPKASNVKDEALRGEIHKRNDRSTLNATKLSEGDLGVRLDKVKARSVDLPRFHGHRWTLGFRSRLFRALR
jgi:hypothetical protein